MKAQIIAVEKTQIYEGLLQIVIPVPSGVVEILPGHAELFCLLDEGAIKLLTAQKEIVSIEVSAGTAFFRNDEVIIIL